MPIRRRFEVLMFSPPVVSLNKHAGEITSPITTDPAETLAQIFGTVFQSRLDFSLFVILHSDLPVVSIQPSGDKVIVVSIQDPLSPLFGLEAFEEIMALEDFRSVRPSAARHAGSAAVHVW